MGSRSVARWPCEVAPQLQETPPTKETPSTHKTYPLLKPCPPKAHPSLALLSKTWVGWERGHYDGHHLCDTVTVHRPLVLRGTPSVYTFALLPPRSCNFLGQERSFHSPFLNLPVCSGLDILKTSTHSRLSWGLSPAPPATLASPDPLQHPGSRRSPSPSSRA